MQHQWFLGVSKTPIPFGDSLHQLCTSVAYARSPVSHDLPVLSLIHRRTAVMQ